MHSPLLTPWLSVHSYPLAWDSSCIHRIDGNTALHRDIYPSVSLQIQKNFAKSKWRVSCPLQGVCKLREQWEDAGGWARWGLVQEPTSGHPFKGNRAPLTPLNGKWACWFQEATGKGNALEPLGALRMLCLLSKPSTQLPWCTTCGSYI